MKSLRSVNWNELECGSKNLQFFHKEVDLKYIDHGISDVELLAYCSLFGKYLFFLISGKSKHKKKFGVDVLRAYLIDFTQTKYESQVCQIPKITEYYHSGLRKGSVFVCRIRNSGRVYDPYCSLPTKKKRKKFEYVVVSERNTLFLLRFDKFDITRPLMRHMVENRVGLVHSMTSLEDCLLLVCSRDFHISIFDYKEQFRYRHPFYENRIVDQRIVKRVYALEKINRIILRTKRNDFGRRQFDGRDHHYRDIYYDINITNRETKNNTHRVLRMQRGSEILCTLGEKSLVVLKEHHRNVEGFCSFQIFDLLDKKKSSEEEEQQQRRRGRTASNVYTEKKLVKMFDWNSNKKGSWERIVDAVSSEKSLFILEEGNMLCVYSQSKEKIMFKMKIPQLCSFGETITSDSPLESIRWMEGDGRRKRKSVLFVSGKENLHVVLIVNKHRFKFESIFFNPILENP